MIRRSGLVLAAFVAGACSAAPQPSVAQEGAVPNQLTAEERQQGFRLLFDGRTLDGWRGYEMTTLPDGWAVVDGAITRVGTTRDIVTHDEFGDFELRLQWKIEPGGNSGIFYRVVEGHGGGIYEYAPEYQVLDDAGHADGRAEITSAGSNFALHPAPRGAVRPADEWNDTRIIIRGSRVEHWLNGVKVVDYELGSDDWKRRVAASKFAAWPSYGLAQRGHIGLQEHQNRVAFRSIRIRELH